MHKITTLYIIASLIFNVARAQHFSLDDCIRTALENNEQLINSQLDVKAAEYSIMEVKSQLLPTVDLTGQFQYYRELPSQYAPASAFGGPEGEYNKMTLAMKQTTTAAIKVSTNLYNQSVFTGLKAAQAVRETSQLQEALTRESLIYNVSATYYTVQVYHDNLARLNDNIANLEKTVEINKVLREHELIAENLHNRLQINLENLRNQSEQQKLLLDNHITLLKSLMNIDMQSIVEVDELDYHADIFEPEEGDLSQRSDIRLQNAQIRLSQFEKKTIAAGYYPVITNSFSYGYAGYYDEFAPFKQINNDWIPSSYFALTVKIPVFDGFKKQNQIRQKEIAIQKNMNTLSQMQLNASKEVEDAKRNFITNKNLLANSKKSLDLAEQLFSTSQSEYENGITSTTELLNAQNDLSNARTNYTAALLNLKLAELTLKKANGSLVNNF
jgi:outer membrane protein TolC